MRPRAPTAQRSARTRPRAHPRPLRPPLPCRRILEQSAKLNGPRSDAHAAVQRRTKQVMRAPGGYVRRATAGSPTLERLAALMGVKPARALEGAAKSK